MSKEMNSAAISGWGKNSTIPQWGTYYPAGTASSDAFGWGWPWGIQHSVSVSQLGQGYRYFQPFLISEISTLTAVRIMIGGTGQAGSTARAGIYNANSYWEPGALLADFGTVDSSTTGNKDITGLSQLLLPGRYWAVIEGSASNTTFTGYRPILGLGVNTTNYGAVYFGSGNGGAAFPATVTFTGPTVGFGSSGTVYLMQLKAGT